ncbi:MAG: hypothetical protein QXR39_06860 [Candidatus Methanomethylicia archaeon]
MSETISNISYKELLDTATRIAVQAKFDGLTKTQIENVIGSLYMVDDPRDALLISQLFAHRQAKRLRGGYKTMAMISRILNDLYVRNFDRQRASELLDLVKWVYESVENVRLPTIDVDKLTFDELMNILRGQILRGQIHA